MAFLRKCRFYFCSFIHVRINYMNAKTTKEMHINISDDLKKQFHATCVMQGKKMNQVVIELIQQWLKTNETLPNDIAKKEEAIT